MIVLAAALAAAAFTFPWLCVPFAAVLAFVLWFFRDFERRTDAGPKALISPADGRVVEIAETDEADHIRGRARKIAIFMNVFNCHVNRAPTDARVEWVRHEPGRFMNAIKANAGVDNEHTLIALRDAAGRPILVNLVAGLIARRIVCAVAAGDALRRGRRLGMIKFGSRVEVFVPADAGFGVKVRLGETVRAGESVLGEFA